VSVGVSVGGSGVGVAVGKINSVGVGVAAGAVMPQAVNSKVIRMRVYRYFFMELLLEILGRNDTAFVPIGTGF
jgi:hypothetical protein